jgi:hypothetical protein
MPDPKAVKILGQNKKEEKSEPKQFELREDIVDTIPKPEPIVVEPSPPQNIDGFDDDFDEVASVEAVPLGARKRVTTKSSREPEFEDEERLILKGRIAQLEEENVKYQAQIQALQAETDVMVEELMEKPEVIRDGISNDDVEYLDNLLASAGVPDVLPDGTAMDLGDRIMFVVSQRSIMITGLQGMRSELTGIAHRARKSDPDLSDQMFELLRRSSQSTNLIAISEE